MQHADMVPSHVFEMLSAGMGKAEDPQTQAETFIEWTAWGCPVSTEELLSAMTLESHTQAKG